MIDAHIWKDRWAGPKGDSYAFDTEWKMAAGREGGMDITVSKLTKARAQGQGKCHPVLRGGSSSFAVVGVLGDQFRIHYCIVEPLVKTLTG